MITRVAWLLNLDAEEELRAPTRYRRKPAVDTRVRELARRMTMLIAPGDRVISPADAGAGSDAIALAFCPTPDALARIARAGFTPPRAPPLAVLARVNSRAFCAELGQTLAGARYVRNEAELMEVLRAPALTEVWVLKRDFTFAGRERRRVHGRTLDPPTLGFVRRSFARGEGLQVEPWLARLGDFAQHGYVLAAGGILLGPPLAQRCDERGGWQATAPLTPGTLSPEEEAALAASTSQAGTALATAGYFGPFGVDAYRYRSTDGAYGFQPRSEINARFSMGYPRALLERALAAEGYQRG